MEKVNFDYNKQKNGWVTFSDKRPKIKLRAYIGNLAKKLTMINKKPHTENRDTLIKYYNVDGLDGIRRSSTILFNEATDN